MAKSRFHIEYLNPQQRLAYGVFQQHDVMFLTGPAGTGKTFLAMAFAINEVLQRKKSRIILTRPIVESGENLGYLPGDFYEKVNPYMMPLYDVIPKLVGHEGPQRESINAAIEVVPLAYMRGRSFANSICLFDEAQNATYPQLKLFLSRFEKDTKLIITGDPFQSDLKSSTVDLMDVVHRLETLPGVGFVQFKKEHIVRHPLVAQILERLDA
jgi:phosphate starvation-inducible protein PhoH and related proteins